VATVPQIFCPVLACESCDYVGKTATELKKHQCICPVLACESCDYVDKRAAEDKAAADAKSGESDAGDEGVCGICDFLCRCARKRCLNGDFSHFCPRNHNNLNLTEEFSVRTAKDICVKKVAIWQQRTVILTRYDKEAHAQYRKKCDDERDEKKKNIATVKKRGKEDARNIKVEAKKRKAEEALAAKDTIKKQKIDQQNR
jgi:hypothetical protein